MEPLLLIGTVYHLGQNDQGVYRIGVALDVPGAAKPLFVKTPITVEQARCWGPMLGKKVRWSLTPIEEV